MIDVKNRTMYIPFPDKQIGNIGDNKVETRTFKMADMSLSGLNFKLDLQTIKGDVGIVDLTKVINTSDITLTWEILEEHIPVEGVLKAQLRAFDDLSVQKWHSNYGEFYIGESINATGAFPAPLPSEFAQMEQRVTALRNETSGFRDDAAQKAIDALNSANTALTAKYDSETARDNAIQKALESLNSAAAALVSEQKSKTSEDNAAGSAALALNNILNGVSAHNDDIASHPSILSALQMIEAIARGKATARTFNTTADMLVWLAVPENVALLQMGDNLYIRDISVPDYWWAGDGVSELEAEAVNLADYYTKTQVDNMIPITIEQTDHDALVAAGTVIAGRIYYVVPDGTLG